MSSFAFSASGSSVWSTRRVADFSGSSLKGMSTTITSKKTQTSQIYFRKLSVWACHGHREYKFRGQYTFHNCRRRIGESSLGLGRRYRLCPSHGMPWGHQHWQGGSQWAELRLAVAPLVVVHATTSYLYWSKFLSTQFAVSPCLHLRVLLWSQWEQCCWMFPLLFALIFITGDGGQMPWNQCSNCIAYCLECTYVEAAKVAPPLFALQRDAEHCFLSLVRM